jgi:uncharacterized Zn finger protein (UPF0148 family)
MTSNAKWRDKVREELKKGGTGPPCPFCGLPRVQRSDYLRCPRCGVNWLEGEALDCDPRRERQRRHQELAAATLSGNKTGKKEEHGGR